MRYSVVLAAAVTLAASPSLANDAAHPVVIELFQSQGCSSCPPANAQLNALADRPDVLALSFAVTYWDQLGWKDTFASPAFTKRQWDYARAAGRKQVATPQMIVNGRAAITGGRQDQIVAAARSVDRGTRGPAIVSGGGQVAIGAAAAPLAATVWLVRYDPRTLQVPVRAGENGGRTLPHRNIVRALTSLGPWQGRAVRYPVPPAPAGLKSAVLVQQGTGGPILAARRID